MNPSPSIEHSHLEHRLWINELEFYREEIGILEKHVVEILSKNSRNEIVEKGELFKGQLHRYTQRIAELEMEINEAEKLLALFLESNQNIDAENVKVGDQEIMRNKIGAFKKDYYGLKKKVLDFEVEWM
ncbi:MAG: hypothetical protein ACJ748_11640 [Flavisolibacter sp.]